MSTLFDPIQIGDLHLHNRIIMAPLTRMRADPLTHSPMPLNAQYYAQRASAGLIIGEATYVDATGYGYLNSPSLSEENIEGHLRITQEVHAAGGRIFLQLWHVGRISHPCMQPNNDLPLAPSAIAPSGCMAATPKGLLPIPTPRALTIEEIKTKIIDGFYKGAVNAKKAGYDGVELHFANGYLCEQFLSTNTNTRTDIYGGSIENRFRLLREVCTVCIEAWEGDASRVGVRLSPASTFNDIHDDDRHTHMRYVVQELDKFGLGYLHVVEPRIDGSRDKIVSKKGEGEWTSSNGNGNGNGSGAAVGGGGDKDNDGIDWSLSSRVWRKYWSGTLIGAGGYTRTDAEAALKEGHVDLVAFGRLFISNPDLRARFAAAAAAAAGGGGGDEEEKEKEKREASFLTPYDRATFYGGGAEGYTSYPTLEEEEKERKNGGGKGEQEGEMSLL